MFGLPFISCTEQYFQISFMIIKEPPPCDSLELQYLHYVFVISQISRGRATDTIIF